jgi:GT2 family glycosyltransferase
VIATPIHGTWRVRREIASKGMVSIIIPTCAANGYIETIISTLRSKTAYRNFEIIVIDNIPESDVKWKTWLPENADKIVDIPGTFNWSIFNNRATEVAEGEYFLFLNDDMEVTGEGWLDALMEHVQRPEVGLAGPQLLYGDGKVQHAGMFLSSNGIGRHAFRFAAAMTPAISGSI